MQQQAAQHVGRRLARAHAMRLEIIENLAVHLDGFHGVPGRCDGTAIFQQKRRPCQSRSVFPGWDPREPQLPGERVVHSASPAVIWIVEVAITGFPTAPVASPEVSTPLEAM